MYASEERACRPAAESRASPACGIHDPRSRPSRRPPPARPGRSCSTETCSNRSEQQPATPCLASRIAVGVPVSIGRLGLVERAEIAVRARLAGVGVQPRDLRVRLLGNGFAVELDRTAHAAMEMLPGFTAEVLAALNGLGLTGAGWVGTYRSPTLALPIGDTAVTS